jgi:hypothetical protein
MLLCKLGVAFDDSILGLSRAVSILTFSAMLNLHSARMKAVFVCWKIANQNAWQTGCFRAVKGANYRLVTAGGQALQVSKPAL